MSRPRGQVSHGVSDWAQPRTQSCCKGAEKAGISLWPWGGRTHNVGNFPITGWSSKGQPSGRYISPNSISVLCVYMCTYIYMCEIDIRSVSWSLFHSVFILKNPKNHHSRLWPQQKPSLLIWLNSDHSSKYCLIPTSCGSVPSGHYCPPLPTSDVDPGLSIPPTLWNEELICSSETYQAPGDDTFS